MLCTYTATTQTVDDVLHPREQCVGVISTNTAEQSRPLRWLREQDRANRDPRGRKRVHGYEEASNTLWTGPILGQHILDAGRAAGPQMKPTEIVRILKCRTPKLFAGITSQVVGRYIERPADGPPRWKESFLERLREGYRAHSQSTRTGILVSTVGIGSGESN
jgi:hypothetical protein